MTKQLEKCEKKEDVKTETVKENNIPLMWKTISSLLCFPVMYV